MSAKPAWNPHSRPTLRDDLDFQPVVNEAPARLSREQIEHYNREGYLRPLRAYTEDGIAHLRGYFEELMRKTKELRPDADSYVINGYHRSCRGIYEIATNPVLVDHVADLVGPDVLCWGTHFFCKQPHDPKHVPWHQDASYWPLSPARTVTVWLAIDDTDEENAAMMFLPRSHNQGHLRWKETEKDAVLGQEIEDAERFGEPVHNVLQAGEFSLHADMLAHGSVANESRRRRCGLTLRYCPPSVRPLDGNWGQAILCRGGVDGSTWKVIEKPDGEDVARRFRPTGAN